jgi:hypothetical protein
MSPLNRLTAIAGYVVVAPFTLAWIVAAWLAGGSRS